MTNTGVSFSMTLVGLWHKQVLIKTFIQLLMQPKFKHNYNIIIIKLIKSLIIIHVLI